MRGLRCSMRRRTHGSINSHGQPSNASSAIKRASSAPRWTMMKPIQPAAKLTAGSSQGKRARFFATFSSAKSVLAFAASSSRAQISRRHARAASTLGLRYGASIRARHVP